MKALLKTLLIATAAVASVPVLAQQKPDEHAGHHAAAQTGAAKDAATDMTEGEVRRVDKEGAKITLKHGEIKNLDMPPMTMVFGVKDKAALDKLKAGDKVRFKAVNEAGKYTVTEIQVVQ
jgi:Cu(I)/Ag(I) efflux system protein CusF